MSVYDISKVLGTQTDEDLAIFSADIGGKLGIIGQLQEDGSKLDVFDIVEAVKNFVQDREGEG
ncbi:MULTISPECIES: hypothetical protein [Sulfitobacter]|jgi:hypothetical protein|uniref:hypothetical protein n=1 Tax=Sulfitobacter TaxID=60136 RepID=UPI00104A72E8|nr:MULTISPECIES: hypothetical protein [Sulfitobacter]UWR36453.1 hypothetical protein K3762_11655 [Sulfitobacter sp. W074]